MEVIFTVWFSGNALVLINEVALRRARLVPGWVTVLGRVNHKMQNQSSRSTQPGHPSVGRRNEYQRKLGSRQAHHVMHWPVFVVSEC